MCFGSYFDYIVEWNKHVDDKKVMAVTFEDMKIVSLIFTHLFFFCSGANWIILVFVFLGFYWIDCGYRIVHMEVLIVNFISQWVDLNELVSFFKQINFVTMFSQTNSLPHNKFPSLCKCNHCLG